MIELIRCPNCGWQNEPSAIMCGGCGQPLRSTDGTAGFVSGAQMSWQPGPPPSHGYVSDSDLPTLQNIPPVAAPAGPDGPPRPSSPQLPAAPWPGAQASQAPRPWIGACLARGLIILAVTLAALAVLATGAWGLAVRPTLHAQVDGAIGQGLGQAVASVPSVTDQMLEVGGPTFFATDADVNALLQRYLPSSSGLDAVTVTFQPGVVLVTYSAYGLSGTVQTTLQVRGGQLQTTQTQVSGIMGWVETGEELQARVNQALGQLSSKTPHGFRSVRVGIGKITVVLNTGA
jgi:zinc-ribbon domain